MGLASAPRADQGDIQLIAGSIRAEKSHSGKDESGGPGEGKRFKKLASFHNYVLFFPGIERLTKNFVPIHPGILNSPPGVSSLRVWVGGAWHSMIGFKQPKQYCKNCNSPLFQPVRLFSVGSEFQARLLGLWARSLYEAQELLEICRPLCVCLLAECESYACRSLGKSFRQPHLPTAFAAIHLEHNSCFAWRMVDGRLDEEKIRPHLGDADGRAIDDKPHFYLGRMCAVTLLRYHERNSEREFNLPQLL